MSFQSARMGLIRANHFGDPRSSSRGEYRRPHEDFTGISRLPSDTVPMIPALTDWIVASGTKNRTSRSRHYGMARLRLRFLSDLYFITLQVLQYEVARSLPIRREL